MTSDAWKENVDKDIAAMKNKIQELDISDRLQEREINAIKSTLTKIEDNTTWIKRAIIGAIITAVIVAVVGGLVTVAINTIYGGTDDESKLESKIEA